MSVSSAPPTAAISQNAAAAGNTGPGAAVVVVQVLASYGGDSVRNGLVQTLQNTAGAGNVLSGTVTDVKADGTFTLQTKAGPELSLQRPPDLPLTVGSAVTLRLVALAPQPQVAILTVDGKLVSAPPTAATLFGQPAAAAQPLANPAPALAAGLPPATLASTLFAAISLEDEVAIESALSGGGAVATPAADDQVQADPNSVIATLVRAAPARPGSAPVLAGTRYLATLSIGNADAEPADAPSPHAQAAAPVSDAASDETEVEAEAEEPPAEVAAPNPPQPNTPPPIDLTGFKALTTVLAGRVLDNSTDSETLVGTAVGTLSIPVQDAPPSIGAAIQLKITAVAPPVTAEKPAPTIQTPSEETAIQPPPLQDAARTLAQSVPALAEQIQARLSLTPNDQLASLILNFIGGLKGGPMTARWPDPPARKALVDAGRSDLATRLDTDASQIGQTRPAGPGDWSIMVLPYLGMATTKPMRLYRRTPDEEEQQKGGGERFVIELEMVRLGALQLDGLVRERRFDLVLRSEKPLEDGLKQIVERTFRDSLLIAGWSGEISYARSGPVPMIPLQPDGSGVIFSA